MTGTVPENPSASLLPLAPAAHPQAPSSRSAGPAVGAVLLACMTPAILASTLIAPVQPAIAAAFADTPGVAAMVPALVTVPGLVVGLLAPFVGGAIDRFGRLPLLVGALIAYALVGMLPLWLDSLPLILASRAVVGVAEGVIVTCAVALTADHFHGPSRDRMFGGQTVVTATASIVFLAVGGALGASNWRIPFWIYLAGLVLAALVALVVPEPRRGDRAQARSPLTPLPRSRVARFCAVTFVMGMIYVTPVVELSFRLTEVGVTSTATIGLISALAAVGTAAAGLSFGTLSRLGTSRLLTVGAIPAGVGIASMGLFSSPTLITIGAMVGSAGCGTLLPTVLSWISAGLHQDQHGRGIGWFTTAFAFGQFATPLGGIAIAGVLGGLSGVLVAVGVLALLLAVVGPRITARAVQPA